MKIKSFSIKNYRSIVKTKKLLFNNYSVLVGPNNEGKSNILRGLYTALTLSSTGDYRAIRSGSGVRRNYRYSGERYSWDIDIPFDLKEDEAAKTEFTLEFELSANEKVEFKKQFAINLSTTLSLKLQLGISPSKSTYDISMKGRAKQKIQDKKPQIALFIKERLDFQYIPCIRTEDLTESVLEELILRSFEQDSNYAALSKKLYEIQRPIIEVLENEVSKTIKEFIPDVKKVSIDLENRIRSSTFRPYIKIDDGTLTDLQVKGDGIKSLTAIALMRHAIKNNNKKDVIILIEEPESHLHPRAIHSLYKVLSDVSEANQIIITTHSPILVERKTIENNIIVTNNEAHHCRNIKEIREIIGVEISDNLISAQFVILVEGLSDKRIFLKLLNEKSEMFKKNCLTNRIMIDDLSGGTNISYKAGLYKSLLCQVHVIVDSDECGKNSADDAIQRNILNSNEVNLISPIGFKSGAEIEDLIDPKFYYDLILDKYNVDLKTKEFNKLNSIWSKRVQKEFERVGAPFDINVKNDLKTLIADMFEKHGFSCIHQSRVEYVNLLIAAINRKIEKLK